MMQPIRTYMHAQGAAAAVINAVLNPAVTWLGNRRTAFVPLIGDTSIIVDIAVTSIVLSLLVSLFITPAAQREFRAGRLTGSATVFAALGFDGLFVSAPMLFSLALVLALWCPRCAKSCF